MNSILKEQLKILNQLTHSVDGIPGKDIPDDFNEVVFNRTCNLELKSTQKEQATFIFEKYIVKPFEGFDFHDKFNNGIAPPDIVMGGTVERETEKMYYINANSPAGTWSGWVPKKSVRVEWKH